MSAYSQTGLASQPVDADTRKPPHHNADMSDDLLDQPVPIRVLVVEDSDYDFRITKKNLLLMDTYRVRVDRAGSVSEAGQAARRQDYDVVLVDFCLGLDTGVLAINHFGGRDSKAALILLTGMPGQDIPKIALKAGALHCLDKNQLNEVLLETTIRSALHTRHLEDRLKSLVSHLEEANRAKDDFYARMSHDLKTPLNAILGYAEMISDDCLSLSVPEKYQECARNIHTGGTHLLEVINNLILHASGKYADNLGRFSTHDLRQIVSQAVSLADSLAKNKAITITLQDDGSELQADCQVSVLTQAILNLLSNAVKYTASGGEVGVRLGTDKDRHFVAIRDNGIGMSTADIDLALTPFGRVELPAQISQEGSGLGLPIVKEIITAHGGELDISSRPGEGTEVILYLPIALEGRDAA
ncbi:MAG: hypothetical protein C0605_03860 [Hyphomicrobiales bacterium]|nr:MAG: hypothetical protein C0605_03860 [Hyphomicrobiales bacterium]